MVLLAGKALHTIETIICGSIEPSIGSELVLNHAGEWLLSSRPWKFLRGGMEALDLVADQGWIDLPDDYGGMLAIKQSTSFSSGFQLTSPEALIALRHSGETVSGGVIWGAITHNFADIQGTASGSGFDITPTTAAEAKATKFPNARIDLSSIPSTTQAGAIILYYRRKWRPVYEDTDTIFVPSWLEPLYIQAACLFAKSYDEEAFLELNQALATLQMGPLYRAAAMFDSNLQTHLGSIAGGAAASAHSYLSNSRQSPVTS